MSRPGLRPRGRSQVFASRSSGISATAIFPAPRVPTATRWIVRRSFHTRPVVTFSGAVNESIQRSAGVSMNWRTLSTSARMPGEQRS
jgi:hypothetical protein